ncbi:GNAT family N-acetyltransferase, partial [Chloroflexota bacterium]
MSDSDYIIRNYKPEDFEEYVRLGAEAERLEPVGRRVSPQAVREYLEKPNYSPEQDLFLAEADRGIVAYLDAVPERAIGRVILYCWVHPAHRRQGLAKELLGNAMRRAEELGAKVAHVIFEEANTTAISVLSGLGFECVRRYLELKLDMTRVRQQDLTQAASECRCLLPGEEEQLTHIQNLSFAGTWGYNPNTVEDITY